MNRRIVGPHIPRHRPFKLRTVGARHDPLQHTEERVSRNGCLAVERYRASPLPDDLTRTLAAGRYLLTMVRWQRWLPDCRPFIRDFPRGFCGHVNGIPMHRMV